MSEMTAEQMAALWEDDTWVGHRHGYFSAPSDYDPLIKSMPGEIVVQVDQQDYQGDTWVLLRDGERWGYLEFGWGSCSGCDALQAADSWEDVADLRNELEGDIHWEPSREAMVKWFAERDWRGEYSWYHEDARKFAAEAWTALGGEGEHPALAASKEGQDA